MSDNQQWAAPGAQPAEPGAPATPAAPAAPVRQPTPTMPPPPPPQYTAPQYAAQPQQYAPVTQQPGWTPPPKPGLIPLRPLALGNILGASFQVMRRNPRTTIVPALVLAVIAALATGGGIALFIASLSRITMTTNAADAGAIGAGTFVLALLVLVVGGAIGLAATAMLQGLIATEIGRGSLGEKQTFGQAWNRTKGRLGAIIGYGALVVLAVILAVVLFFVIVTGLVAALTAGALSGANPNPGAAAGATIGLVLFAEFAFFAGGGVLVAWLGTKLAFVPSAIVLERLGIRAAIARSWRLTRRAFWRTFGILILVYGMVYIATSIVTTPVQLLAFLGGGLVDPTGVSATDPTAILATLGVVLVGVYVVQAFVGSLGMVLESATGSLLYVDARMRKEGLDLELGRYVEGRAAGADLPDPFLPHALS